LKKREQGFDLASIPHARLKEYSALHDPNMRHYFENTHVQRLLYETGQIDKFGRVISLDKNKSKLNILEREFQKAEQIEQQRLKEEQEMRVSHLIVFEASHDVNLYMH
jgi:glucan phosphoethanolaminetransferase (alkaline phosphatase superfamily)